MECKDVNVTEEGKVFRDDGREYPQRKDKYGYYRITTYDKETRKCTTYLVHRLVAQKYIPNPLNHKIVNHIDGDKTNNNVSNLEWVDQHENNRHAYKMGLRKFTPRRGIDSKRDWKGRFTK